jgi:hypothetical protein
LARARTIIGWAVGVLTGLIVGSDLLLFVVPYLMAPDSLDRYRNMHYSELKPLIGSSDRKELIGRTGARYQFVMSAFWDSEPDHDIRMPAEAAAFMYLALAAEEIRDD